MRFKTELPPPEREVMEHTICEEHIAKRQQIAPKDLAAIDAYEKEKNCCPACEAKRVAAWGKPTDVNIQTKVEELRKLQSSNPAEYQDRIEQYSRYAHARDNNDVDSLDIMTWAQFVSCERDGQPFWTSEDYKKLLSQLEN